MGKNMFYSESESLMTKDLALPTTRSNPPVEHATSKVQTCDIILGNKDFMFVLNEMRTEQDEVLVAPSVRRSICLATKQF